MSSNAVSSNRVATVVGYLLDTGDFRTSSPNLPQRVAIIGEVNHANQSAVTTLPVQITSAKQAGDLYGYGSPVDLAARILFPVSGGGIQVPVWVYPQLEAVSAVGREITVTVSGTATANVTHYVWVAGRNNVDGQYYAVNIVTGDTDAVVGGKIKDAINAVLRSPVSATNVDEVVTAAAKWYGLTSQSIIIRMDTNGNAAGMSYVVAEDTAGSGTPSITASLNAFGTSWNTWVVNCYGTQSTVCDSLESFNGIPDKNNPTGRYSGIIMRPFIALTGSVADDPTSFTDARKAQVTIAICPAPKSEGLSLEAAANMCVLAANISQDNPQSDVINSFYPDMPGLPPTASDPATQDYNTRDAYVKKGCSTTEIIDGRYQVKDFVTTFHPTGDAVPSFRWCRNLMVDFNVRYGYYLLEQDNLVGKVLVGEGDIVVASNTIKASTWAAIIGNYAVDLAKRALIADAKFMAKNTVVSLSPTNPDRFDTTFPYKRTGIGRISATTAFAGFNYGTI